MIQSVKLRVVSVMRDVWIQARAEAVTAGPTAMVSFPKGRHLMDILRIPRDY